MTLYAKKHWDCPTCRCAEPLEPIKKISDEDEKMLAILKQDADNMWEEGFYTMANRIMRVHDRMKELHNEAGRQT